MYLSKGQFDLAKQYCKVGVTLLTSQWLLLLSDIFINRVMLHILMKYLPNRLNMNSNKESKCSCVAL